MGDQPLPGCVPWEAQAVCCSAVDLRASLSSYSAWSSPTWFLLQPLPQSLPHSPLFPELTPSAPELSLVLRLPPATPRYRPPVGSQAAPCLSPLALAFCPWTCVDSLPDDACFFLSQWTGLVIPDRPAHLPSESESCSVVSDSLRPHGLYSPWNSPGQNTGVGILSLLQGIFPTQGSNLGLPDCKPSEFYSYSDLWTAQELPRFLVHNSPDISGHDKMNV